MAKNPTRRKKVIIVSAIIVVVLVIAFIGVFIFSNQSNELPIGSVVVSGRASSAAICQPMTTSLQKIDFVDIQTGITTSYDFHYNKQSGNPFGNYSVILKNGHTYSVYISYYVSVYRQQYSDYIDNFSVNATNGETVIYKNFG
jgi:hypothetical protein